MSILDLLQHIVNEPAPKLGTSKREFAPHAVEFVAGCLDKDPVARKSPQGLLVSLRVGSADPQKSSWIVDSKVTKDTLKAWLQSVAPEDKTA